MLQDFQVSDVFNAFDAFSANLFNEEVEPV